MICAALQIKIDEELLKAQQAAYKVEGVDEDVGLCIPVASMVR